MSKDEKGWHGGESEVKVRLLLRSIGKALKCMILGIGCLVTRPGESCREFWFVVGVGMAGWKGKELGIILV